MGSGSSKSRVNLEELDSPIYEEMKKTYGEKIMDVVPEWIENHGFPKRGTFSVTTLNRVKDSLEKCESKLRDKGKLKNKQKDRFQTHKKVMSFWLEEADRKRASKEIPFKEDKRRGDTAPKSSLKPYGEQQCKVDHNLDPWPHCQPSQSYSSSASPFNQDQAQETATMPAASASSSTPLRITKKKKRAVITHRRHRMRTRSERPKTESDEPNEEGPEDGEEVQFARPMVQVAGPNETNMVFQPWSEKDLKEAMTHLPNPRDSGFRFADELQIFCQEFSPTLQELKRLLMLKLGATVWHKIGKHCPTANAFRTHVEWNHAENEPYRSAVELLCQHVETALPVTVDFAKIDSCEQRKDESVGEYYVRLYETFSKHSGIAEPPDSDQPGIWELFLLGHFLNGLRPELSKAVKQSCVGWEEVRLDTIRYHAIYAEKQHEKKEKKKKERTEKELLLAARAMYKTLQGQTDQPRSRGASNRGRGRGRGRDRGPRLSKVDPDTCYLCGEKGHWKNDCPSNRTETGVTKADVTADSPAASKEETTKKQVKDALPVPAERVLHNIKPGDIVAVKNLRRKH